MAQSDKIPDPAEEFEAEIKDIHAIEFDALTSDSEKMVALLGKIAVGIAGLDFSIKMMDRTLDTISDSLP